MNSLDADITDTTFYHLKIKDWPEEERPREKLYKHGASYLSDAELLAILIGSGSGGVTAVDVAKRLLLDHKQIARLAECNLSELCRMKGIGSARAARMIAAFEIGRRIESHCPDTKIKVNTPSDIVRLFQPGMRNLKQEVFKVVLLDSGNYILKDIDISTGTLNASLVHPREVFKTAVDHLSAGIILLHNHPSGEASPSEQDKKMTEQMYNAGQVMGIPVLDHLIITKSDYFSFASQGLL